MCLDALPVTMPSNDSQLSAGSALGMEVHTHPPEPIKVIVAEDEVLVRLMLAEPLGMRASALEVLKADEVIALMNSIGADVVVMFERVRENG